MLQCGGEQLEVDLENVVAVVRVVVGEEIPEVVFTQLRKFIRIETLEVLYDFGSDSGNVVLRGHGEQRQKNGGRCRPMDPIMTRGRVSCRLILIDM